MEAWLSFYLNRFSHLNPNRNGGWDDRTLGRAPHKPILLLSILDLFAQGRVITNLIEITPELGELFAAYWSKVLPERRGNLALPFFHLRSSGFWHLLPQSGQEAVLDAARQVDTLSQLGKLTVGASLDDHLFQLLQNAETRNALRAALIQTYFAPEYHADLLTLGEINMQAFIYSQHLIEQARRQVKETPQEDDTYQPVVRDQGFRKAVVRIYDHRCAFCGVRMLTTDGHTAVDAAHIIPWSISHDDDPHNGMALCGLCHWTFDQGLMGVSARYQVLLSRELRITQNVPGHLLTLESRSIIGPVEQALWPHVEALGWHHQNVFRQE
ncbi:MAG: HNH endonuclease [Chloroflexota bacterium]